METVTADFVKDKKVLLRYDLDIPLENGQITDDFRLRAGLETLRMCLENANQIIMMGHVGRPKGEDSSLSVAPIYKWLLENGFKTELDSQKLRLLENLRFEEGEDEADLDYAKELAALGEVYVNEAIPAYRKAASTTVLPTLMPHRAGINFAKEVAVLTKLRDNPKRPFLVIIGGAKVDEKLAMIQAMSKIADDVLVGGKLIWESQQLKINFPSNVMVGELTAAGNDITPETLEKWGKIINQAKELFWNGPVGKTDGEGKNEAGTRKLAEMILESEAIPIVGGGDTGEFLARIGLRDQFMKRGSVLTGGGASGEFLAKGTLLTIEALS